MSCVILIDVPDEDLDWLDRKAAEQGKSRAALVREAIAEYRAEKGKQGIERFFGIWRDRKDIGDGLEHQRRMRDDWDRSGSADRRDYVFDTVILLDALRGSRTKRHARSCSRSAAAGSAESPGRK